MRQTWGEKNGERGRKKLLTIFDGDFSPPFSSLLIRPISERRIQTGEREDIQYEKMRY